MRNAGISANHSIRNEVEIEKEKKKYQSVCKPGFVWQDIVLRGNHSSGAFIAEYL